MQKRRRRVDFTNNWMFGRVMTDESICRDVIRAVLGIEAVRVEYLNAEQVLDPSPEPRRPHGRVRSRGRLGGAGLRPGDAGAAGAPPREALPVLPGCPGCEGASRWGRLRPVARELRRLPVQPGSLRVRPARLPPRAPMRRGPRIAARGCLALARAERPGMGGRAGRRSARSVKICRRARPWDRSRAR